MENHPLIRSFLRPLPGLWRKGHCWRAHIWRSNLMALRKLKLLLHPCFTHLLSYFSFRLALKFTSQQRRAKNDKDSCKSWWGGNQIHLVPVISKVGGDVPRGWMRLWGQSGWCIKLGDITSLGSVQVVGFFDVAARLCAGDGPIAALVGGSSCSIGSACITTPYNDH